MPGVNYIIGKLDHKKPTVVWGAGVSGLLIAYFLKKNNVTVIIKERKSFAGGKINSLKYKNNIIEQGANALFLNTDAYNLIIDLNLGEKIIVPPRKLKRLIFKDNKVFSVSSQIPYARIIRYLWQKTPEYCQDMTLSTFLKPWLGPNALQNLIDPALGGIYATKSNEILLSNFFSFDQSTFPRNYWQFIKVIYRQKKIKTDLPVNGSIGFIGGMNTFIDALIAQLQDQLFFNNSDDPNFNDHNNIICTDTESAQNILQNFPEWTSELKKISYNSLSSNTILLKKAIPSLQRTFGVVFVENKRNPTINSLGILANHNVFSQNYLKLFSYTLISKKLFRSKEELIADLRVFDSSIEDKNVEHISSTNLEKGLPVYNYPRYLAVSRLHEMAERKNGLCLFGNYVAGISIREMIVAAKEFAAQNGRVSK